MVMSFEFFVVIVIVLGVGAFAYRTWKRKKQGLAKSARRPAQRRQEPARVYYAKLVPHNGHKPRYFPQPFYSVEEADAWWENNPQLWKGVKSLELVAEIPSEE